MALGTGGKAGDLSEKEKGRAKQAASQFIVHAYGYTGEDSGRYASGVNQTIIPHTFYESPGAASVKAFEGQVGSGGTESKALLDSFELTSSSQGEAMGVAYFTVEDTEGKKHLSQELELTKSDAAWRVSSAEEPREA